MTPRSRSRRLLRLSCKFTVAVVVTLVTLELVLRGLLFGGLDVGGEVRRPENFADSRCDDVYWKLHLRFAQAPVVKSRHDALLGYVRPDVTPGTYEHTAARELGGRRPVLLFGDSFANCVARAGPEGCWEDFMERSALSAEWMLINYGEGGYGLDQTVLLMERALELYAELRPVVVISLLEPGDMYRSVLRIRDWPKCHFALTADGGLELDSGSVAASPEEFVALHPPAVKSYLWRYLLHGTSLVPERWRDRWSGWSEREALCFELNRRLLQRAVALLESTGTEYFFLFFQGPRAVGGEQQSESEAFLTETLEQLAAPFISAWPLLFDAAAAQGRTPQDFYFRAGRGLNHYTREGNAVVFRAFERGLAGDFDSAASLRARRLADLPRR